MSNEESNYITQKELDKIARERRERQLKALQDQEQKDIAAVLNTSDGVAAEALALGIDAATAIVLPLIPLIEVAWADGKITQAESDKVMEIAHASGVRSPAAMEFLELLLGKKPSQMFFDRINRVIKSMVEASGSTTQSATILEQAHAVAAASGGFFGMKNAVSDEERALLEDLAKMFDIS